MYTLDEFCADTATAFAFLERDFSMQRSIMRNGREASVDYRNTDVHVAVNYEVGAGIWVNIEDLRYERKPLDTSRMYGLDDIARVLGVPRPDSGASTNSLSLSASFLASSGRCILNGDFAELHKMHDRLLKATLAGRERSD
jgi:hypothetical protein